MLLFWLSSLQSWSLSIITLQLYVQYQHNLYYHHRLSSSSIITQILLYKIITTIIIIVKQIFKIYLSNTMQQWPCGLMDKAPASGVGNCRFESCQGRNLPLNKLSKHSLYHHCHQIHQIIIKRGILIPYPHYH